MTNRHLQGLYPDTNSEFLPRNFTKPEADMFKEDTPPKTNMSMEKQQFEVVSYQKW